MLLMGAFSPTQADVWNIAGPKTDRLDPELLKRGLSGWLVGTGASVMGCSLRLG